ncbi:TPA: hypothetical protein O8806_002786 [Staphylococcus aureus]|jgi:hypothetical protein|uniref:hypothetical protein n=1 Tax=Cupriavidus TaxID=106589 RepID=UPI000464C053|nr:hypothetical protein [Cupriavidus metallidurans]HDC6784863.1 hypothetical protein [Staphylococcus aureus]AVA32905.1 hypothetical protein C3Z06_04270 [Cupriavidus metallidurans]AVA33863.1 hypothetical protein C3Z06_09750 [Cupriavidus metallidurans]AVA35869.1 hypothetical protein C3Z06_21205 [Cupriavidus metallidurans]AVA38210.1 hypothetical protein C3Z06_31885 [Cupriavidus metallidurans]
MTTKSNSTEQIQPQIGTPQWLDAEVQRYLCSGDHDCSFAGWPGMNFVDVAKKADQRLRTALVDETLRLANGFDPQVVLPSDLYAWARTKLAPMVHGLFRVDEQPLILDTLARSVVFLTPQNIVAVLMEQPWLSTTWSLANLYLYSVGVPGLSQQACHIVGLSAETTSYVSMSYFHETDPFADFVVHEAAHVFHNCKRATVGLDESRSKEFLLNIDYTRRETFAYACEAYSRICSMATSSKLRQQLLEQHAETSLPADDQVDHDEYLDILAEAVRARNGWQRILKRCAPAHITKAQ